MEGLEGYCDDHEMVVFCRDRRAGLRAIIAIHDTTLGPGLGGCRMRPYPDGAAALSDALKLSRGMTFKYAAAGIAFGGAKAVIIADPTTDRTPALLAAFADFVERLHGEYITAEDAGTTTGDMRLIAQRTAHVRNCPLDDEAIGGFATACGVRHAMLAALAHRGRSGLNGASVVIEGVGKVGMQLAGMLHADGARLYVADLDDDRAAEAATRFGATVVAPRDASRVVADIYSPCALGGVLNADVVSTLGAGIVAGAANNQLADPAMGRLLRARDVIYCPDYVANAGGVLSVAQPGERYDRDAAMARVRTVYDTVAAILVAADRDGVATSEAADALVLRRLAAARSAFGRQSA